MHDHHSDDHHDHAQDTGCKGCGNGACANSKEKKSPCHGDDAPSEGKGGCGGKCG